MKNNVSLSDSGWNLQSNYTQISDKLFSELKPDEVTNPRTVIVNNELLGLVTIGDIVKARLTELEMEKEALEGMIMGY